MKELLFINIYIEFKQNVFDKSLELEQNLLR